MPGELSDMPLQPGIVKFEFAMGAHGLVWTQGTTIVERVSCQARFLGVRPGWSISMVNGMPITDSVTCWHELQKCKKSGLRYSASFLKDEASIREDLTKAEAERQKRATKAAEERLEQQARATAAAERQRQARKRLEMLRKDFESEIEEARALAEGKKSGGQRTRAALKRLMAQVAAIETQNAWILDAVGKIAGAGLTAKFRAARISAEIQETQVTCFMTLVEQLYAQKPGTILDELLDNLKETGPAGDATPLQIQLLAEDELLAIATWALYAMKDVDIDGLFCFEDAPELPEGLGEPALRDEFYSEHRQKVGGKRNPQIFQVANWASRVCFDSAGDRQGALGGLRAWIRSIVDGFRAKAAGDRFFWAAPSSTTVDASISEARCNQQAHKKNNVLFAISGITHASPMMELSAYPGEREWLPPPFTALDVERVVDGAPLQLHCKFGGCMLTSAFREEVRGDFKAASRRLSMRRAESQRNAAEMREDLANLLEWAKSTRAKTRMRIESIFQEPRPEEYLHIIKKWEEKECLLTAELAEAKEWAKWFREKELNSARLRFQQIARQLQIPPGTGMRAEYESSTESLKRQLDIPDSLREEYESLERKIHRLETVTGDEGHGTRFNA
ncbi:unnamed protein product, partial [Prorocentrum cordatum]